MSPSFPWNVVSRLFILVTMLVCLYTVTRSTPVVAASACQRCENGCIAIYNSCVAKCNGGTSCIQSCTVAEGHCLDNCLICCNKPACNS